MILALAVSLAVLFMAGEGRADFFDGQKLNNLCSSDYLKSLGFCDGYVLGVFDAGKVVDKDIRKRHWKGGGRRHACRREGVPACTSREEVAAGAP